MYVYCLFFISTFLSSKLQQYSTLLKGNNNLDLLQMAILINTFHLVKKNVN